MSSNLTLRYTFLKALSGSSLVHLSGAVMAFLVGIQLARGLGVEGYGLYGSAMAAASLGATAAAGGVQLHATREIAALFARDDEASATRLLTWSIRSVLVLALIVCPIVAAYLFWGLGSNFNLILATTAVTLLLAVLMLTGAILRGAGSIVFGQAINIAWRPFVFSIFLLLASVTLGSFDSETAMALGACACAIALLAGIPSLIRIWRTGSQSTPASEREKSEWRRNSVVMGTTTIIRAADAAVPLILVGMLANFEEAGLYRVAVSSMLLPAMPATMITIMIPAMVVGLYEQNKHEELQRLSAVSSLIMSLPTLCVAAVLWAFGAPLIVLAFGSEYEAAWLPLTILSAAALVTAIGGISNALLHAARREAVVTRAFGLSLIITGFGSFLLAQNFGSTGVAIAVLAAVCVRTSYLVIASIRATGLDPSLFGAVRRLMW